MSINTSGRQPFAQFGRDLVGYVPAQLLPTFISFITTIVFARLLGAAELGKYVLLLSTANFITTGGTTWITAAVLRYYARYEMQGALKKYHTTVLVTLFIEFIALFLIGLILLTIPQIHWTSDIPAPVLVLGSLTVGLTLTLRTWLLNVTRAGRRVSRYAIYSIVGSICLLAFSALGILFISKTFEVVIWTTVIVNIALFAFEVMVFTLKYFKLAEFDFQVVREFFAYGVPLTLVALGAQVLAVSDRFFLDYFYNSQMVGIYSALYSVANSTVVALYTVLKAAVFPILIETHERKEAKQVSLLLEQTVALFLIVMIPCVAGIVALAPEIGALLGNEYTEYLHIVLPLVSFGVFLSGLAQYVNIPIELSEKTGALAYIWLVSAVVNLALNFLLIPRFAIVGASVSTLVSYAFYLAIDWIIALKRIVWRFPAGTLLKTLIASALMYVVVTLYSQIPVSVIGVGLVITAKVAVGGLVYLIILLLLKERLLTVILGMVSKRLWNKGQ